MCALRRLMARCTCGTFMYVEEEEEEVRRCDKILTLFFFFSSFSFSIPPFSSFSSFSSFFADVCK